MRGSRSYEIGPGFNPLRYDQTSDADWAVLTVTESLPADDRAAAASPRARAERHQGGACGLSAGSRLRHDRGSRLRAAGEDRRRPAFAAHLPRHQGLFRRADPGRRGGGEMQIAGIQIATMQSDGAKKMIAVPAQAIWRQDRDEIRELRRWSWRRLADARRLRRRLPAARHRCRWRRSAPDWIIANRTSVSSIPIAAPMRSMSWRGSRPSRSPSSFRSDCSGRLPCGESRSEIDSQAATTISTAVVADDSNSGVVTGTAGISSASIRARPDATAAGWAPTGA